MGVRGGGKEGIGVTEGEGDGKEGIGVTEGEGERRERDKTSGLQMTHSLHIFDAPEPKLTPLQAVFFSIFFYSQLTSPPQVYPVCGVDPLTWPVGNMHTLYIFVLCVSLKK